ncbi:MAG: glycosyltransferase [Pseudomonadota bacterium]
METRYQAARQRFSRTQKFVGFSALLLCAYGIAFEPIGLIRAVTIFFIASSLAFLLLRTTATLVMMRDGEAPPPPSTGEPLSFTLLCPLYREADGINNLLRSLRYLDYPEEQVEIVLLLEADDDETANAITEPLDGVQIIINTAIGPRTKPNALNLGLAAASGQVIGVYDAEDRPDPGQLSMVNDAMHHDPRVACVQARLNYYNRDETILTRLFCLEYSLHFDYMLPGLVRLGLPIPLGGTSNFVRREALEAVGGWDAYNVTEDADLGLRLSQAGYKLTTIPSNTFEEATEHARPWIKQRSRWLKGYLQTWLVHTRRFAAPRDAIVLHAVLGAVVANALLAPPFAIAFAFWVSTRSPLLDPVFTGWVGPASLALLIGGNALHAWLLVMAPLGRGWYRLAMSGLLLPVYWTLQSAAAYRAVFSFIRTPHYWAKTDHTAGEMPVQEAARA